MESINRNTEYITDIRDQYYSAYFEEGGINRLKEKEKSNLLTTSILESFLHNYNIVSLPTDIIYEKKPTPMYYMFTLLPVLDKTSVPIEIIRRSRHA